MNIVAEVISCLDKIELNEINIKVPELQLSNENLKTKVIEYIENIYVKYSERPKHNKALLDKAQQLEAEMKILKKSGEYATKKELIKANEELEKHINDLNNIECMLNIVIMLCKCNEKLIEFGNFLGCKQYLACMNLICDLDKVVKDVSTEEKNLRVIDVIRQQVSEKKNILLRDLSNVFTDHIISRSEHKSATLKIKKNLSNLQEALLALYCNNPLVYSLHDLSKYLWNSFFVPIVDFTVEVEIKDENGFSILEITILDSTKKSTYSEVFSNLKIVLEFLKSSFDLHLNEKLSSLKYIGEHVRDNLSEIIIKHCLEDTIPSTAEGLQKYKVVIEDTQKLETVLRNCDIFTETTSSLFEYANNIDILFINKKCQEYLSTAEEMMKKDLHDMTEVGVPYNPEKPMEVPVAELLQCSVSKSVIVLGQFEEGIIQQAIAASDLCAGRLFYTVKNIVLKYGHFVPQYHNKLLQAIPQQVALFHNNCLYLSYKLTEWNQLYSSKLSSKLDTGSCQFSEEVHQLQQIAVEHFSNYNKGQIKQIHDIMAESGLAGPLIDNLPPKVEKCIRQCLRQQELLKTVWHKVLSYPVYNQTIGAILNSLCIYIITCIIKYEDIPSVIAEQLGEILKIVLNRGPKLFTDPKEVSLYVGSWYKLNELNFVLSASLIDINDRWADGKGPLALQFKAEDLRSLIRALFQNTDRRAAVLAKIQD